ncbi:intradiol ring-cleavage dioxygenase [Devosia sp.]|uniref:intradiol ring-cleavage dioxygenase n=1 Tax=Devosia sp. TaxID=1871048 RepID=UPI003264C9F4
MTDKTTMNRRQALSLVAITAAGGAMLSQQAFAAETGATAAQTTTLMPGADVCVITPEVTEGPYYFDPKMERLDITEGRPGVPTRIKLQVVDATCAPMSGARVDIWHADATGLYSGYANQGNDGTTDTTGQTFMRGTVFTNVSGIAEFVTTYPGWYRGRTTHVHFKVFLDTTNILTGQIFFPDALSEYIYLNVPPYSDRGAERDTLNSNDNIAAQATRASFAYVKEMEAEYLVAMIIGVDPNATSMGMPVGGATQSGNRPAGPRPDAGIAAPAGASGSRGSLVPGV